MHDERRMVKRSLPLALLVLSVAVVGAAAGRPVQMPLRAGRGLAGQFLVATEELGDPHFARTVIVLTQHDASGAMGLVVNRPLGDMPLARLLEHFGMKGEGAGRTIRVHYGGPVEPARGFVLHTTEYSLEGTEVVGPGIALTARPEILQAIATGKGPRRFLFAMGYAGWAPGQLEREMDGGYWISVAPDADLLFDQDHARKWERALARQRIDL